MTEADPLYAEIELSHKILRVFDRHCDRLAQKNLDPDDVSDALMELWQDSLKKVAQTVPTTAVGRAAKITFCKEAPIPNPFVFDGEEVLLADSW